LDARSWWNHDHDLVVYAPIINCAAADLDACYGAYLAAENNAFKSFIQIIRKNSKVLLTTSRNILTAKTFFCEGRVGLTAWARIGPLSCVLCPTPFLEPSLDKGSCAL